MVLLARLTADKSRAIIRASDPFTDTLWNQLRILARSLGGSGRSRSFLLALIGLAIAAAAYRSWRGWKPFVIRIVAERRRRKRRGLKGEAGLSQQEGKGPKSKGEASPKYPSLHSEAEFEVGAERESAEISQAPPVSRAAVFWDVENLMLAPTQGFCRAHVRRSMICRAIGRLRSAFESLVPPVQLHSIRMYADFNRDANEPNGKGRDEKETLSDCGVTLIHTSHRKRKEVADNAIIANMFSWAMDNPGSTIGLITSDMDFAMPLQRLRERGHRVVLFTTEPERLPNALQAAAHELIAWKTIGGKQAMTPGRRAGKRRSGSAPPPPSRNRLVFGDSDAPSDDNDTNASGGASETPPRSRASSRSRTGSQGQSRSRTGSTSRSQSPSFNGSRYKSKKVCRFGSECRYRDTTCTKLHPDDKPSGCVRNFGVLLFVICSAALAVCGGLYAESLTSGGSGLPAGLDERAAYTALAVILAGLVLGITMWCRPKQSARRARPVRKARISRRTRQHAARDESPATPGRRSDGKATGRTSGSETNLAVLAEGDEKRALFEPYLFND